MRNELLDFFSGAPDFSGLLVAEAPTGYGKTYETVQAMYQYARNGGKSQILFVTNLLKNLPYEELYAAYCRDGKKELFVKEVIRLQGAADTVEDVILSEKIPLEFKTDAYNSLRLACKRKQEYQRQGPPELVKTLSDTIRSELEPAFRHELEKHLRKKFPRGPKERRKAIRNNRKYQWMAKFYPAVFLPEYKIVLMSTKKLLARNISLVEPNAEYLSDRMLKNKIVCIDEFDASRAVILDSLIERACRLRADYLHLFLQIYRGTATHQPSRELEQIREQYQSGRTLTWENLLRQGVEIYTDCALHYSIKTVDSDIDTGRKFLFHDTSYHTVLDGGRTHIRAVRNDEQAQVQIHFETKEAYNAHRDEPRIGIQNLLRRIHVFLLRFQRYVYGWAECYAKQVNAGRKTDEDLYTPAAAAESIYREYGLTQEQARLMMGDINSGGTGRHCLTAPDLSFYETGFRLFEFVDDDLHHTQTYLQYLQMQNTPEKVLLYLCRRAKVVGLSATAALPTVLGNYDLGYLKEQLQERYQELSAAAGEKIRREMETVWSPYEKGAVRIDLQIVDREQAHLSLSERLENIFACRETARIYEQRLNARGISDYARQRYCNIFTAMKSFWVHSEIRSFLCLNQALPKPDHAEMDEKLLEDVLKELQAETAPQDTGSMTVLRSGDLFDADKDALLRALENGEKRFILSSYQTLGAGQNLQYAVTDRTGLVLLREPASEQDGRFLKKDMDALYLGDVTNVKVNLLGGGVLSREDLMKYCFQVECLYENDEISYRTLSELLKDGIGRLSKNDPSNAAAQKSFSQTASVRRQITRDVIQAVGRMGRTFLKRPVVYLFTTEKVLSDLDPACLENRLLSPEMQTLYRARMKLGRMPQDDTLLREAERKAARGNVYIKRMLSLTWTGDSMKLWKTLRETVLKHPRADAALWQENPVIRTYYIPLAEEKRCYFFAQKGDFSEVRLSLEQDKAAFASVLREDGLVPSQVSEEDARLPLILSYPGMRDYFISQGWAAAFGTGAYIMSPVLFQNIYKGALGEAAGSFILRQELGLSLRGIEDAAQFEVFDFMLDGGLYFDFKHWKSKMRMDDREMRRKTLSKLDAVGGKRAFVINLISDGESRPSCTGDKRLIEIPGLLLPDGQADRNALHYVRRFLL